MNTQLKVKSQRVLGDIHRSLRRVLDRHKGHIDVFGDESIEDVGNRIERLSISRGEVGLAEEGLFGEGAMRSQKANPRSGWHKFDTHVWLISGHVVAGYACGSEDHE